MCFWQYHQLQLLNMGGGNFWGLINHFLKGMIGEPFAVIIFFFISGFLFFRAGNLSKEDYCKKINRRVKALLIPYIIGNTLYLIPTLLIGFIKGFVISDINYLSVIKSFYAYPGALFNEANSEITNFPIDAPLWYMRDLMIVCIFSPLVYLCLKRFGIFFVSALLLGWIMIAGCGLERWYMILEAFAFFSMGALFPIRNIDLEDLIHKYGKLLFALWMLFLIAYPMSYDYLSPSITGTIKRIAAIATPFVIIWAAGRLINRISISKALVGSNMFVYMFHYVLTWPVVIILSKLIKPTNDIALLSVYSLSVVLIVFVLSFIYGILNKFIPKVLEITTGR